MNARVCVCEYIYMCVYDARTGPYSKALNQALNHVCCIVGSTTRALN